MMRDDCAGGRRFSTHRHPWGADLLSTTAAYISGKAGGCYYDASVFFQQLANAPDTLPFRERVLDIRPQSPDLTGCRLRLFPALFGEAVAGFSGPVLSLISFFGLLHVGSLIDKGVAEGFPNSRQQKKTKNNRKRQLAAIPHHLQQSITFSVQTPVGTRPLRRREAAKIPVVEHKGVPGVSTFFGFQVS
jgi:hypothetical protein